MSIIKGINMFGIFRYLVMEKVMYRVYKHELKENDEIGNCLPEAVKYIEHYFAYETVETHIGITKLMVIIGIQELLFNKQRSP